MSVRKLGLLRLKTFLYSEPDSNYKTSMYLIRGDQVTLQKEKIDIDNNKWYLINYKGKKDIDMWIKADALDLN